MAYLSQKKVFFLTAKRESILKKQVSLHFQNQMLTKIKKL